MYNLLPVLLCHRTVEVAGAAGIDMNKSIVTPRQGTLRVWQVNFSWKIGGYIGMGVLQEQKETTANNVRSQQEWKDAADMLIHQKVRMVIGRGCIRTIIRSSSV